MGLRTFVGDLLRRRYVNRVNKRYAPALGIVSDQFDQLLEKQVKASKSDQTDKSLYDFTFTAGEPCSERSPFPEIFWETPYGFVLTHSANGTVRPIALVGFKIKWFRVVIVQIQGVRGAKSQLIPLRWEELLVEMVKCFAKAYRLKAVYVMRARTSLYNPDNPASEVDLSREEVQSRPARMYLRYDKNAKRMGFKLSPRGNAYVLYL